MIKKICFWIIFIVLKPCVSVAQEAFTPPNIVLIFMDDLGYADLSSYGALGYSTPNMDQMAAEGIRMTNFLTAQAVCTASRAALLTGCYPNRIGFSGAYDNHAKAGLQHEELTIAEMLKKSAYKTAAIGKWHLGHLPQFLPMSHGFDQFFGLPYSNDMWPVDYDGKPSTNWKSEYYSPLPLLENYDTIKIIETLQDQGLLTRMYTEKAIQFIESSQNEPFFLYLAHSMPHVPIAVSNDFKGKSKAGLWGDLMTEIDWSIGEILSSLDRLKLDENTLIIFTSDNGPWLNYGNHAGSTGGLREGKGTSYEGGHRVPCIFRWKSKIKGSRVSNHLMTTLDILPTIAQITKSTGPLLKIDGIGFQELLYDSKCPELRNQFYYYYRRNSLEAVRSAEWKYVFEHVGRSYENQIPGQEGFPGPSPENTQVKSGLYHLGRDPGERYDLQETFPDVLARLLRIADEARIELGDDLQKVEGRGIRPNARVSD